MKPFLILLALWPGTMLAQSCGQELHDLKKQVEDKEKECKLENERTVNMSRYRAEIIKLKRKHKITEEVCL